MYVRQHSVWRVALAFGALAIASTFLAFQLTGFKHHYDTHVEKHRILRSLQELPSLCLHQSIKRESMYIFGTSQFDVFANPAVTADSVSYDGTATFDDVTSVHKYLFVDGAAYHIAETTQSNDSMTQEASCLDPSDLPPVHKLLGAINAATAIDSVVSADEVACANGQLFTLVFSGGNYVLCSTLASGEPGFKIFGSDFDIEFTFLNTPAVITKPTLSADAAASCKKVPSSTAIVPSTMDLLSGAARDFSSRALRAQEAQVEMVSSRCGCKGPKRACIFIPGRGSNRDNGLQDSNSYLADIKEHAPCCSSVKFAITNTNACAWNDAALQQRTCDLALRVSNSSNLDTKTIEDTTIVAHSMGNMILGGAIANENCKLGAFSLWVALSAPMKGSMGANFLQDICAGKLTDAVSSVAELIGKCPANAATQALSYQGSNVYTSTLLNAHNGFQGLLSIDKTKYGIGGTVIPHRFKENDGIAEYQSCATGLSTSQFGATYSSKFYVMKLNHADTAFRHSDALFNSAQKPAKWFECLL